MKYNYQKSIIFCRIRLIKYETYTTPSTSSFSSPSRPPPPSAFLLFPPVTNCHTRSILVHIPNSHLFAQPTLALWRLCVTFNIRPRAGTANDGHFAAQPLLEDSGLRQTTLSPLLASTTVHGRPQTLTLVPFGSKPLLSTVSRWPPPVPPEVGETAVTESA